MTKTLKVNSIYLKLVKQALEDGEITEDENAILTAANEYLKNFKELYDKAWKDNVITEMERKLLEKAQDRITTQIEDIANADNVITDEEKALLKVFEDVIEKEIKRSIDVKKTYSAVVNL